MSNKKEKINKILTLIALIVLVSIMGAYVYNCSIKGKKEPINLPFIEESYEDKMDRLGYDPIKDSIVNKVLDEKPVSIENYGDRMTITYKELQFDIYHENAIPFRRIEKWYFHCTNYDGKFVILESDHNVSKHKVRPQTIERIKSLWK